MDKKFIYIAGGGLLIVIILIVLIVLGNTRKVQPVTTKDKVLAIWDYKNEKTAYDQIINSFQTENNIKVSYVTKDKDSYLADTVNAIAAGNGPDVWIVPNDIMPQYHDKMAPMPTNSLADVKQKKNDIEIFSDNFSEAIVKDNTFNEKIYGMPIAIDNLKLFINTNLLSQQLQEYRKNNPKENVDQIQQNSFNGPKNWNDFVQMVKFFSKNTNGKFSFSTAAIGTTSNIPYFNDIFTLLMMQNGAKMTSDDLATAQFHTAQNQFGNIQYPGTKALEFYTSFANPKNENYTWNSSMPDAIRAFAEGKTAMIFDYDTAISKINLITPDLVVKTVNVPQVKETENQINLIRYDTLTVAKSSTNSALAWKFILKATSENFSGSYLSITKKQTARNSTFAPNSASKTAQSWYNPDPTKIKTIFTNTINQVNTGANAQTALDGAAGQITTLLGKLKSQ